MLVTSFMIRMADSLTRTVFIIQLEFVTHCLQLKLRIEKKSHIYPQPPLPTDEDSDVAYERHYVESLHRRKLVEQSLVCKDLTKYYKHFLAVNRLTFGKYIVIGKDV